MRLTRKDDQTASFSYCLKNFYVTKCRIFKKKQKNELEIWSQETFRFLATSPET